MVDFPLQDDPVMRTIMVFDSVLLACRIYNLMSRKALERSADPKR